MTTRIPRLPKPEGSISYTTTSVQALAHAAAATVPGVLVVTTRQTPLTVIRQWFNLPEPICPIILDPQQGTQLTIDVAVEVAFGTPIPALVDRVRKAIATQISETTGLQVEAVNVTIANIAREIDKQGTKARIR